MHGLGRLLELFETSLLLCAFVALAALAAYQIVRPIVGSVMLYIVKRRLVAAAEAGRNPLFDPGAHRKHWWPAWMFGNVERPVRSVFRDVPTTETLPVFMRLLQDTVRGIAAQPYERPRDFAYVTRSAGRSDVSDVIAFDALRRADPAKAMALVEPKTDRDAGGGEASDGSFAMSFAASQEAVQDSIDRFLNHLQARLEAIEAVFRISTIVILAAGLTFCGALYVGAWRGSALFVGFCAGVFASFIRDLAVAVVRRR